jgi:DNA-binding MarR family transcriptional regulator
MSEAPNIPDFDRLIHEPSRLAIVAVLYACERADFTYLLNATELTKGNLSSHVKKLEEAGYVDIHKGYKGNYPYRTYALTKLGRKKFEEYRKQVVKLAKQFDQNHQE